MYKPYRFNKPGTDEIGENSTVVDKEGIQHARREVCCLDRDVELVITFHTDSVRHAAPMSAAL